MKWVGFLIIFLTLVAIPARSEVRWAPTYGSEIEFSNRLMQRSAGTYGTPSLRLEIIFAQRLVAGLKPKCQLLGCRTEDLKLTSNDTYQAQTATKVIFPDGFYIVVTADPACIEIKSRPSTLNQWRRYVNTLQALLFDTAEAEGFLVGDESTAGQISIGVRSTFGDDGDFFMRFLIETQNRPELALGIFNLDLLNAPPLSVLSQSQRDDFENLAYSTNGQPVSIETISNRMNRVVYAKTTAMEDVPEHYQAVSLEKAIISDRSPTDATRRVELRFIRSPGSMREYVTQLEFLETWLAYIKQQPTSDMLYAKSNVHQESPMVQATRFAALLGDMNVTARKKNQFWSLVPNEVFDYKLINPIVHGIPLGRRGGVGDLEGMQVMRQTADLVLISPTARAQYAKVLSDPRAIRQNLHSRFFDELSAIARARLFKDPRALQSLADFMMDVEAKTPDDFKTDIRSAARHAVSQFPQGDSGQCRLQFKRAN